MALAIRNHAAKIQNLCIQQYRRLLFLLREKRSKYLSDLKREKEIYGKFIHKFEVLTLMWKFN